MELLKQQKQKNKFYGAIGAAPAVVLYAHGLLLSPATFSMRCSFSIML